MAADASIYGMIRPVQPVNQLEQLAQVMQIQGLQRQGELGEYTLKKAQREDAETNALNDAYRNAIGADGSLDRNKLYQAITQGGLGARLPTVQKGFAEADKADAELRKTKLDTTTKAVEMHRQGLAGINSPQDAAAWLQAAYQNPDLKPLTSTLPLEQAIAKIPADPDGFQNWRNQMALGMTKFVELNKPHITTQDLGGQAQLVATPGLGGAPQVLSSTAKTMTPGDAARLAQDERHFQTTQANAGNTFDSERGVVVNTRTGTARPVMANGQPLAPKSDGKALTEGQAKANLFGTRMKEADRILNELEGQYWPAAVNAKMSAEGIPVVGGQAGAIGNLMLTSEGQQAEQAQRDFINAVLRRESGATIMPAEFANAQKQYFPQPNDDEKVLAQKRRNRALAIRGLEAEVPGGFRGAPSLTTPGTGPVVAGGQQAPAAAPGGWSYVGVVK